MKAILFSLFICFSTLSQADVFVVNDTGDVDLCDLNTCTLRGAINQAMTNAGIDTINFDIPADALNQNYIVGGSGQDAYFYWLIQPGTELPELNEIILDGTTAGSSVAGNPSIVIDGSLAGTGTNQDPMDGLTLLGRSTVKGVAMIYWDEAGLRIADGSSNLVTDSWFGLNLPYGLAAAPNRVGIQYDSDGNGNAVYGTLGGSGNVISGNTHYGVASFSQSENLVLYGNLIGTDPDGQIAVPNDRIGVYLKGQNHRIGSSNMPLQQNLISGNLKGMQVSGFPYEEFSNIEINNNIIGLNMSAQTALPNRDGIYIQWGRGFTLINNTIAGNESYGIDLAPAISDIVIENNRIGVNYSGTGFSNNTAIWSSGGAERVVIGPDNIIAKNRYGVRVIGHSTGHTHILRNQIYENDYLGIDLGDLGTTLNDAGDLDSGPNRLQNYPDVQSAQYDASGNRIQISFSVDSQIGASDYPITIDIYAADISHEEGQIFLASTTYTAAQYLSGTPVFRTLFADAPIAEGDLIVTTATDAAGRTSEFSPPFTLGGQADFSISCQTNQLTTSAALTCSLNCQAEAVNGWNNEAQLSCTNPDSNCTFIPSEEIAFTSRVVPFVLEINHAAGSPGVYASEVLASSDVQGGTVERQEILTIKQLADGDHLFKDGFEGIVCQ